MAAPAAPAAGAGIEAIAGLLVFATFLFLVACQKTWKSTIGWLLHKVADLIDVSINLPIKGSVHPLAGAANSIRAASDNVYAALGRAALATEHAAFWLFAQAQHTISWVGREIAALADDTYKGLNDLITRDIPATVGLAVKPLKRTLHGIDELVHAFKAQLTKRLHGIDELIHTLRHGIRVTLPHAISAVGTRVGITAKQLRRLARRVTRTEKLLGAAAFTAAVGVALNRLGLKWLRCPALGRIGRKIGCGGFAALEPLLAATFESLVVLDLCRYALAMQQLAKVIVPQLGAVLLVPNAVCLGGGATLPTAHDSPKTLTTITPPTGLLDSEK